MTLFLQTYGIPLSLLLIAVCVFVFFFSSRAKTCSPQLKAFGTVWGILGIALFCAFFFGSGRVKELSVYFALLYLIASIVAALFLAIVRWLKKQP